MCVCGGVGGLDGIFQRGSTWYWKKTTGVATCRLSRRLAILKLKMTHFEIEKKTIQIIQTVAFSGRHELQCLNYVIINRTQIELEIATQNVSFRCKVIVGNNAKHVQVQKPHFATTHTMVSILYKNSWFIPHLTLIVERGHTQANFSKARTTFSIITMYGMSDTPQIEISQNAALGANNGLAIVSRQQLLDVPSTMRDKRMRIIWTYNFPPSNIINIKCLMERSTSHVVS